MDGYQLLAEVVKAIASLAWPAAFFGAVWLFRQKLTELLPLLRLKYKDLDVSFRLDQAEKEVQALPPPEPVSEPTPEETDKFLQLVKVSPRAAIMERRLELEDALTSFANAVGLAPLRPGNMLQLTRDLRKHGLIDQTTSALLDDLRAVGNAAAHKSDAAFSGEDARRFGDYAERVIQQLRRSAVAAAMGPTSTRAQP